LAGIANFASGADDFASARFRADGTLDTTYNSAGAVPGTRFDALGSNDRAFAVTVLADNSLVLAGGTDFNPRRTSPNNFAVAKYDANASAVSSRVFEVAAVTDEARGVTHQLINGADKIVAVGFAGAPGDFAVARLNADLTDDTTFDADGRRLIDLGADD